MQSRTGRHLDASDFGAAWCDGRSAAAHRYTALSQQHQSDIGGVHFLAFPVVQVVLEVAVANAELEILEEKVVLLFEREAWRYGRPRAHCARAHCARAHCAFRTAPARTAPARTAPPRTAPARMRRTTHHDVQRVEDIHIAIAREHKRVAHELSN